MNRPSISRVTSALMVTLALPGVALLTSGCVSKSAFEAVQADYEAVVKERNALNGNNNMLRNHISELEQKYGVVSSRLDQTASSLGKTSMELQQQQELLNLTRQELETRDQQLSQATSILEEKEAVLQELSEQQKKDKEVYEGLVSQLNSELSAKQVKITQMKDGISLNLSQEILFDSGSADLNAQGREVLTKVSEELKDLSYQTVVSGHTDNVPISGRLSSVYPTNWDLAGARAARVVNLLEASGVSSQKLVAVSFGEHQPVASNEDAEGRALNRRIEIRLRPMN